MPCAQNEKAVLRRTAEKTLVNRVLYSITDFQKFVKSGLQILTTKKPRRTARLCLFQNYASSMVMTCLGQTSAHLPQPMHFAGSTFAQKFVTFTAPTSHAFMHLPQPIQPTLQTFIVSAPLSQLEQRTTACFFSGTKLMSPSDMQRCILRSRGIRHLVFTGIATNVCVESSCAMASFFEYFGIVLEDATHQAGPAFAQQAALFNIETFFRWVSDVESFCHAPVPRRPAGFSQGETLCLNR